MLTAREAVYSLFGAYRLAFLDRAGMQYFERTPAGALRSFYAAAFVLPGYILLVLIRLWDRLGAVPLPRLVAVEGISYVVSWTGYALLMYHVARFLDRETRYVDFLCAYNWSSVIQMAVYLPAVLLAEAVLLPPGVGDVLVLVVTVAVLAYQWFIARTALDLSGGMAVSVVLIDVILSMFITGIADGML